MQWLTGSPTIWPIAYGLFLLICGIWKKLCGFQRSKSSIAFYFGCDHQANWLCLQNSPNQVHCTDMPNCRLTYFCFVFISTQVGICYSQQTMDGGVMHILFLSSVWSWHDPFWAQRQFCTDMDSWRLCCAYQPGMGRRQLSSQVQIQHTYYHGWEYPRTKIITAGETKTGTLSGLKSIISQGKRAGFSLAIEIVIWHHYT